MPLYVIVAYMKKTDTYYQALLQFARIRAGSYKSLAAIVGAPSGPAVQAWVVNGVAHKWRPVLDAKYGAAFRKSLADLAV